MVKNNLWSSRERSVSWSLQPSQTVAQDAKCPSAGKPRGERTSFQSEGYLLQLLFEDTREQIVGELRAAKLGSVCECRLVFSSGARFFPPLSCNSRRGSGTTQLHRVRNSGAAVKYHWHWADGKFLDGLTGHHDWVTDGLSVVEDSSAITSKMPAFLHCGFRDRGHDRGAAGPLPGLPFSLS